MRPSDIFCTSVFNSAALEYDEIAYLLTEYAGDENVEAYVQKLLKVWRTIADMHSFLQKRDQPGPLPKAKAQARALQFAAPPPPSPKRKQIQAAEEVVEAEPKEKAPVSIEA